MVVNQKPLFDASKNYKKCFSEFESLEAKHKKAAADVDQEAFWETEKQLKIAKLQLDNAEAKIQEAVRKVYQDAVVQIPAIKAEEKRLLDLVDGCWAAADLIDFLVVRKHEKVAGKILDLVSGILEITPGETLDKQVKQKEDKAEKLHQSLGRIDPSGLVNGSLTVRMAKATREGDLPYSGLA